MRILPAILALGLPGAKEMVPQLDHPDLDLGGKTDVAAKPPEIEDRLRGRVDRARECFQNDRPLE